MIRLPFFLLISLTLPAAATAQHEPTDLLVADTPTPTVFGDPDLVQQYQATISRQDLAAHLYFFASDFFEGRETTTRGQKMAAQYLASQYRKIGVLPKGTGGTGEPDDPDRYLQPFPLYESKFRSASLAVSGPEGTVASSSFGEKTIDGDTYLRIGSAGVFEGPVVFAGYGIRDPERGYNDYDALSAANLDVSDKWLLVLDGAPRQLKGPGGGPSVWETEWWRKLQAARQYGVRGLMVAESPERSDGESFAEVARRQFRSRDGVGSLALEPPEGNAGWTLPVFHVDPSFADRLLDSAGMTTGSISKMIEAEKEPVVAVLPGLVVKGEIAHTTRQVETENVVAIIPGRDPDLAHEAVVISAHYDHVGKDPTAEGDGIYNGADDDGSGTVALLEMAEAFMEAVNDGYGPRRSVVFLNVSGEEKGLLGSSWFTDHEPLVPLGQVVANLNIDMIGRFDPSHPTGSENYVYIIGSKLISDELHHINTRVNEVTGTALELDERFNSKDDPNQFYRRSDHWNFGKNDIPFIFFFTGTHEDYHGVDDEADRVEYERMTRITRLIFGTAWQLANQDVRPAVSGTGFD